MKVRSMPDYIGARTTLAAALAEELVGPCPRGREIDCTGPIAFADRESSYGPWRQLASGEEILQRDRPIKRYGIGVLYPPQTPGEVDPHMADGDAAENDAIPSDGGDQLVGDKAAAALERIASRSTATDADASDFDLSTANSYRPSAIGLSFLCEMPLGATLSVDLTAGRYTAKQVTVGPPRPGSPGSSGRQQQATTRTWWLRSPVRVEAEFAADDIVIGGERNVVGAVATSSNTDGLDIQVSAYTRPRGGRRSLVTVSVVNRTRPGDPIDLACLFQVRLRVTAGGADDGARILPYEGARAHENDPEEESLALLYRGARTFAVGHGCAADWHADDQSSAHEVSAECLPSYEAPSITPEVTGADGKPFRVPIPPLAGLCDDDDGFSHLEQLVDLYAGWIATQNGRIPTLAPAFRAAANRHMNEASRVLERIRDGLAYLKSDERALRAFRLANHAMLLQQLRTRRRNPRTTQYNLDSQRVEVPEPLDVPDWRDVSDRGEWRPFQIAFVLMSLRSTANRRSTERETVELIFFPTGGGKTEAYLCLSAFSMFHRRLSDPAGAGVDVLMRYTLRLLTAQQFQRASALICAMEHLRRKTSSLGVAPFTIGIWVGGGVTPNTRADARAALRRLNKGESYAENQFVLLRCPWCAAQMGEIEAVGKTQRRRALVLRVAGYVERDRTVVLHCPDVSCEFKSGLPIEVVDEDIYDRPPTMVIGTIDKFAMLAWKPEARAIFGLGPEGERTALPPNLIIQDELHLISGPLGSLAGLYETLIDELCTDRRADPPARAKVVTSTATIRRSEAQIRAIYARADAVLFPARGLDADDSFFARYAREEDGSISRGRLYIGIHGPGLGSVQTAQVRTFAALLQAAAGLDREVQDPWWTLAVFFNSLRELGTSLSLLQSDIPDYLKVLGIRLGLRPQALRRLWNVLELTSRLRNDEIPKAIDLLELPVDGSRRAVDICLASSIVEVGIDIDRLSLMCVVGQPKTTSQYIQVTGRIGRKWWERPGMVATVYSASKPRDRSHFEKFRSYHERLYAQVEPTSVTPFSPPVLDRALHAVLVAYVRQLGGLGDLPRPVPDALIAAAGDLLAARVRAVDPHEAENLSQVFQKRHAEWRRWKRIAWSNASGGEAPLIRAAGDYATRAVARVSWPVPQSLRNVDAQCQAEITDHYLHEGEHV